MKNNTTSPAVTADEPRSLEEWIQRVEAENETLRAQVSSLLEDQKRQQQALRLAATRMEILTGRMRACHQETGRHELIDEAEMFAFEARAAARTPLQDPTQAGEPR